VSRQRHDEGAALVPLGHPGALPRCQARVLGRLDHDRFACLDGELGDGPPVEVIAAVKPVFVYLAVEDAGHTLEAGHAVKPVDVTAVGACGGAEAAGRGGEDLGGVQRGRELDAGLGHKLQALGVLVEVAVQGGVGHRLSGDLTEATQQV
jgi:hypothetical protein